MMKKKHNKRILFILLFILCILTISIGYAILSQRLLVDSSISYSNMSWDVGFSSVTDNGGTISSTSSITNEGKGLNVICNLGDSTNKESCIIKATITNNSSFDIALTSKPSIMYNDTYIHTVTLKWNNHPTYENHTVLKDNFIAAGTSQEVILTIKTKFLKKDDLRSTDFTIPVTVIINFAEWRGGELPTKSDLAILKATSSSDTTAFRSSEYKEKIKTITFEDKINIPSGVTSWDIGINENTVKAYVTPNQKDSTYYDLYIQSNGQLYANQNMSHWFRDFTYVDAINNLELLDTSMTTNMEHMFSCTGLNSKNFSMNISNLDTSSVSQIGWMFQHTGQNCKTFNLDVSNFDTSNVTNMRAFFQFTGANNGTFTLDVSNFDTSNVIDMGYLFYSTGYSSSILELDVSNFDISNVTSMDYMFFQAGYSNQNFTLDVTNFNTSNATNIQGMFEGTGYNSLNFTLDVSNFDTSKVTNMYRMFRRTGYNSTKFNTTITIRNNNITSYEDMFNDVATKTGSQIKVNYTKETEELVDAMIATKSSNSKVYKGKLVS